MNNEMGKIIEFNKSQYLKDLRWHTLGMRWMANRNAVNLADGVCLTSDQTRVQSNLCTYLRKGRVTESAVEGEHLSDVNFQVLHDGKSFRLKISGEFWGNSPKEKFRGINFSAKEIQAKLSSAERRFRLTWDAAAGDVFNIGHQSQNIWFNVSIPFRDRDELIAESFAKKLRHALCRIAEAFSWLLPYRVPVNASVMGNGTANTTNPPRQTAKSNNDTKIGDGERLLQIALDYDFARNGKPHDPVKAVEFYKKCVEIIESDVAYYNLALSYINGDGVAVDKKAGYRYMWKACRLGHGSASYYIGNCYECGKDVEVDLAEAAKLYRAAADKGHCKAAYRLGLFLKSGRGVQKNPAEAFRYFAIAIKADEQTVKPEWLYEYALCCFKGFGTAKNPEAGIGFMRKAAEAGVTDAQYEMANAYKFGLGVGKDGAKRWGWLKKAAEGGNMHAAFEFGDELSAHSPTEAAKYLQIAADQGHAAALALLERYEDKQLDDLKKLAQSGAKDAQFKLGLMYLEGDRVSQSATRAFEWFTAAAEQGDKNAWAEMGWCYLDGNGVPRANAAKAFECFKKSVGNSFEVCDSMRALKGLYRCYKNGEGTAKNNAIAQSVHLRITSLQIQNLYQHRG